MKKVRIFNGLLTGVAVLAMMMIFSSCKKNDVDEEGSARIKLIHASSTAGEQSFYLANNRVHSGLTYQSESDYIVTNSGNRLSAEFRNESGVTFASGTHDFRNGRSYTVFLAGDGQNARIKVEEDDLSAPSSGKAKVRFVHLSDAAPQNVDIKLSTGATLAANLGRNNVTSFSEVDTGIKLVNVFSAGESASLGDFNLENFAAGKIYTVYITGAASGNIQIRKATHN